VSTYKQYQIIELDKDVNPVEFVKSDGFNYEYNGESVFILKNTDIKTVQ